MQAGEYKDRVEVYAPDNTTDRYGDVVATYEYQGIKWCKVIKARGSVQTLADSIQYVYPFTFLFRHYVVVTKFFVLKYAGEYYAVDSVIQRPKYVEVNAHTIEASLINIREG